MLSASSFERTYLILHMGSVMFGWNRQEGWRVVADPDAGERERHRARMNDLIFNKSGLPSTELDDRLSRFE
jgi:hypothetical protein